MAENESEKKQEEVLAASADQPTAEPAVAPAAEQGASQEEKLEQARKFLQDAQVQDTTPERKAEFLKSKGLSDSDIEGLLKEVTHDGRPESQTSVCSIVFRRLRHILTRFTIR
jgi:hypothetical protein